MDNIRVFIKARAKPSDVNLQMNGIDISDVGSAWSLGTITETPTTPWQGSQVNATFTWTPQPSPPNPDIDIRITFSAEVRVSARKINQSSLYQAEVQSYGDYFSISNASQAMWTSYYYVAVPNGYSEFFFFNSSKPTARTIDTVSDPQHPTQNFSYWTAGVDYLNVSVYEGISGNDQNGFWRIAGHSPNIIDDLHMWSGSSWVDTYTYRANDNIRFRAQLDTAYNGATVTFFIYDTQGGLWDSVIATVVSGYAESTDITLDPYLAEVGQWTVQAFVNDSINGDPIDNVGMYSRVFDIEHSTGMHVIYPVEAIGTWTKNATYGDEILLQVRVNNTDNGDLLAGGATTYNWTTGTHPLNDMGTGEYSIILQTSDLPARGRHVIVLTWALQYYDPISRYFVLNLVEETSLQSPDAPGVDVPRGWDADLELFFTDSHNSGIGGATISCNWTDSAYSVTPIVSQPGHYTLSITTDNSDLGTYAVLVNASSDYYVTSQVVLFVQIRQLFSSVAVSSSYITLPVGHQATLELTYWDTDHDLPINNSENSIRCNWSEHHQSGDLNYTVTMTQPGKYEVVFYSRNDNFVQPNDVVFYVEKFATQNHTFVITISVETRLTLFSLDNSVEPTPYTGNITIYVNYYDMTIQEGIGNGTANDYNVSLYVMTPGIDPLQFLVVNGSGVGHYVITIPVTSSWVKTQLPHHTDAISLSV
jgi:hypothetical protein